MHQREKTNRFDAVLVIVVDETEWMVVRLLVEGIVLGIVDTGTAAIVCHVVCDNVDHQILECVSIAVDNCSNGYLTMPRS